MPPSSESRAGRAGPPRWAGPALVGVAGAAALFHLFGAGVSPFTALIQRPAHLAFMIVLGFLGGALVTTRRDDTGSHEPGGDESDGDEPKREPAPPGWWKRALSWGFAVSGVLSCIYLITQHQSLVDRTGNPTSLDVVAGVVALVVVLELARRTTGWGLVVVALLALAYALAGPHLPGVLAHRGYGPVRLVEHLYLSTEGLWGIPLGVSADFVYLFILFGVILEVAGGGALLIGLANRVAGGTRGGPAKTAAVASALMGSLSGSAVANVVTTGAFTIPLMRRAGFRPYFAGAIEAAASTGGQLMPPVMGAGAFILATWTNIPYGRVALAALIPATLYYLALLAVIHFRAVRVGLEPTRDVKGDPLLPRLHLLLPLVAIVALLAIGRSPMRAAFWGVATAALSTMLRPATRLSRRRVGQLLLRAGRSAVQVAAACAAAGIVVGVASLTGIGLRMSELIVSVSGGSLPIALVLTALGSIVLGMGLPTTAAYVVLAALGAPALTELGVPLLAAHLFIFYFGCISNVTPPVSLAAFAAAGVAESPPVKTAFSAAVLATGGFLVPFVFVYSPGLLLEASALGIVVATVSTGLGLIGLAAATMGHAFGPLPVWARLGITVGAVLLILPGAPTDALGLVTAAGFALVGPRPAPPRFSSPQGSTPWVSDQVD